jgi:hypothetical protein
MANIIGGGDMPQGPQQPRVDISNSTALVCKECGYDVFIGGMKFRKLSKSNKIVSLGNVFINLNTA